MSRDAESHWIMLVKNQIFSSICRNSSLLWAGTDECKRKQSLHRSSVKIIAFVSSWGFRIWYLSSSRSTTSREENPIRLFGNVFWRFLLSPIKIGRLRSDRVQKVLTKDRPMAPNFQLGWKIEPRGKCGWVSAWDYFQQWALLASIHIV